MSDRQVDHWNGEWMCSCLCASIWASYQHKTASISPRSKKRKWSKHFSVFFIAIECLLAVIWPRSVDNFRRIFKAEQIASKERRLFLVMEETQTALFTHQQRDLLLLLDIWFYGAMGNWFAWDFFPDISRDWFFDVWLKLHLNILKIFQDVFWDRCWHFEDSNWFF